jgi:tetratricopeptide (TPR) repeat protein
MKLHQKYIKILSFILSLIIILLSDVSVFAQLNNEQKSLVNQYAQQVKNYKANNQLKEASLYLNKSASVYLKAGIYQEAIDAYSESAQLNEQIGNDADSKKIYNNIAMIYSEMGQLKNSLKYFEKSLLISRRNNNKEEIAVSLMDISTILNLNKQYAKATEYLEEALKISNDLDNFNALIACYNLLAQSYKEMGNTAKSDECYKKYVAMEKLRREGKTSLANTSDNFIAAKTEDLTKEIKPKGNNETTENLSSDIPQSFYNKTNTISNDTLSNQLKQSRDKAANLELEVLNIDKELKELKETRLKTMQKKQDDSNLFIISLLVLIAVLIFSLVFSIILIRKKESEIDQLKDRIAELKKEIL